MDSAARVRDEPATVEHVRPREGTPMRIPRPTYANVVGTLALFVALGGSSYAAVSIRDPMSRTAA